MTKITIQSILIFRLGQNYQFYGFLILHVYTLELKLKRKNKKNKKKAFLKQLTLRGRNVFYTHPRMTGGLEIPIKR